MIGLHIVCFKAEAVPHTTITPEDQPRVEQLVQEPSVHQESNILTDEVLKNLEDTIKLLEEVKKQLILLKQCYC